MRKKGLVKIDYDKVKELVAQGRSRYAIAIALGVHHTTFVRREAEDPELAEILSPLKKKNELTEDQYKTIRMLAHYQCTEGEIAQEVGLSPSAFSKHKISDPRITLELDAGYNNGKISLRRAQFRVGMDRYLTICKTCSKISEGEFLAKCSYCESENVTHKFVSGNANMLVWLGKQILGQIDKLDTRLSINNTDLLDAIKQQATDAFKEEN